ncbi:glycosyltransferase [Bosea sp. 117]|uniref:glycosyltransferase n=1 Tax=Bosea sp. 117 TaxID=1125973 RepID=UPI0006893E2E|nr:glycosyltransferase [Bosea sp. 117]
MTSADAATPKIAVVIPVFRHSALVFDALASLLAQPSFEEHEVVIVDDGCPNVQTAATLAGLSDLHPNIHYLRQINRGLSGARNRGITYALEHFPACEAIFFLDADNRLEPHAFARFEWALAERPADWFYPDIRMFGFEWNTDYSGPFRRLGLMSSNICEAGSLVRTRVFRSGARFDEAMREGFEDWEFWLNCLERGFRGEHLPDSGFRYRKRAESMLSESHRVAESILAYMDRKHPWRSDLSVLSALEHVEAPRYAIIDTDSGQVRLTSDPRLEGETLSLDAYAQRLREASARPNWHTAGGYVVMASGAVLERLASYGLLNSLLWDMEFQLEEQHIVAWSLEPGKGGRISLEKAEYSPDVPVHAIGIRMNALRRVIVDPGRALANGILTANPDIKFCRRRLALPEGADAFEGRGDAVRRLVDFCLRLGEAGFPLPWGGRYDVAVGTHDLADLAIASRLKFDGSIASNKVGSRRGRIAFALPIVEFGGVEKVTTFVAKEMRRAGYEVDLFVLGPSSLALRGDHAEAFDSTFIVDQFPFNRFDGFAYLGTQLPSLSAPKECTHLTSLLSAYEAVFSCHAADALGSFAALRKLGVVTVNYLHLLEYTLGGRMVGLPIIGLAYEHATDLMLTCSRRLATELGMMGVPGHKIAVVPNAPGMNRDEARIAAARAERARRHAAGEPLNVVYFGRFDFQKGMDRLFALFAALRTEPTRFRLSVIGGSVVGRFSGSLGHLSDAVQPAVYDEAGIADIYEWADVLVLPSRFEGAPLSILEAKMYGVVPVATDVGAVSEIIADGEDGFLVKEDDPVADMIGLMDRLAADRTLLAAMSERAVASADGLTWSRSVAPLLGRLEELIAARRRDIPGIEKIVPELASLGAQKRR